MGTLKLALMAAGICALLGASTNARAKFDARSNSSRPSPYRSPTTQRPGSYTARIATGVKSKVNAGAIRTKLDGAKSKLTSLTKGMRLGAKGKPTGAKSGLTKALGLVTGVSMIGGAVAVTAAGHLMGMDPATQWEVTGYLLPAGMAAIALTHIPGDD